MQKCSVCGGADFYKEAGYFFCETCQTQSQDVREEVFDIRVDSTTRIRKTKIRQLKIDRSDENLGWTSWELYNFVLIGLTNELIELGVSPSIKLTILQLWTTYLGKIEVAFISTKKRNVPKLARRYKKRDAEIIYGKVQSKKEYKKRKRTTSSTNTSVISGGHSEGSSVRELNKNKRLLVAAEYDRYLQSQASSAGDSLSLFNQSVHSVGSSSVKSSEKEGRVKFSSHAKEETRKIKRLSKNVPRYERVKYRSKHISTQYKMGPHIITPMRLWAIIYLALRIHNEPIHLGDMLRYGREGHLSYYKLDHLLPPEISLTSKERSFLTQNVGITHRGMRRMITSMAKFLGVWNIGSPDLMSLVNRYCLELGLPRGIQLYAGRLIALSPPKMVFDPKISYIPNYEGRAMAFIIVVLKTLLGLDGITEYQISCVAEKINRIGEGECKCYECNAPCIIVHGGAGNFNESVVIEKMTACKKAAVNGYKKLLNGGTSVDAVESALWWLECDEFFNCGYGSVLNEIGKVQMDASIMDGFSFKCGSIAAVSDIEHPITLAKYVMNNFPNSIFVGEGAKNLAKYANINWLSEGNMVAPAARLAFHTEEKGLLEPKIDNLSLSDIDPLRNSFGTVGCVAYDGYSIAAGTTTGGLNKKLVGRVGDTPLLGCGTYATRSVGCSLTGHGESLMKLGLSREIVEDIEHGLSSEESLYKHLNYMFKKYNQVGGGIVLQLNGRWGTYFTSNKMPYAVIENDLITYGARLYEERREMYKSDERNVNTNALSIDHGLLNEKLFSFQEWQKYMECRKTILVHAHVPTRLKYSPESYGIDDLYIKFLEFIASKSNRKQSNEKNSKHFLPEELVDAMTRHVISLNVDDVSSEPTDIFPPSLTPLHSYLEHLMENPLHDVPRIVHSDFYLTKVGYMTKPNSLIELAKRCNITLEVINSNLHFLEKLVPPFEQPRMPRVEELKELVDVQDDSKSQHINENEDLLQYLHAKTPCILKFDTVKKQYYTDAHCAKKNDGVADIIHDFTFTGTLPNGRLAIPMDSDSESEEEEEQGSDFTSNSDGETILLGNKFCAKYNLRLSRVEKKSIYKSDPVKNLRFTKLKFQPERNLKGQFVKGNTAAVMIGKSKPNLVTLKKVNLHTNAQSSMENETHNLAMGEKVNLYTNAQSSMENKTHNLTIDERVDLYTSTQRSMESETHNLAIGKKVDLYTSTQRSMENETHNLTIDAVEEALHELENISTNELVLDNADIENGFLNLDNYLNLGDISFFADLNDTLLPEESKNKTAIHEAGRFFSPFKEYWMYHCIFSRVKPKNFAVFQRALPASFRWLLNECALILEMTAQDLYEEVCLIETYHSQVLPPTNVKSDSRNDMDSISKNQLNYILSKW